jgi:hypothetical protein
MTTACASNERICCNLDMLDHKGEISFPEFWNANRYDLNYIIGFGSPQTAAPLLRREDLLVVKGFRAGLSCAQEFDLYLRLAIQLGITFVSHGQTGVLVRRRKGSVSDIPWHDWSLIKGNIMVNAVELITEANCNRDICRDAIAQRLMCFARELYRTGNLDDAARFATIARQTSARYYEGVYKSWPAALAARTIGFTAYETLHKVYRTFSEPSSMRPL